MHICLLSREYPPDTGWGGIGTYTYNLAHGLTERGHRVDVVAQATDGERQDEDGAVVVHRIRGVRFPTPVLNRLLRHTIPRLKYNLRVRSKLVELIAMQPIDVVEGPNFAAETLFSRDLASDAVAPLTVVRLVTPLDKVLEMQGTRRGLDLNLACRLEHISSRSAKGRITSSAAMADDLAELYRVSTDSIHICPLGIPLPSMSPAEPAARDILILFVGTLSKRKGVDTLIAAAPQVLAQLPTATVVLVGRDSTDGQGQSYRRQIECGIPESVRSRIQFIGRVDDDALQRWYARATMVVAPSRYESFGQVYIEAMAHAKPLVAATIPPAVEVATTDTAVFVPAADAMALAEALVALGRDPERCARLGAAGLARVRSRYSVAEMARRTEEIYYELLARGQR